MFCLFYIEMKSHDCGLLNVTTALGTRLPGLELALLPADSAVQGKVLNLSGPLVPSLQKRDGNSTYLSGLFLDVIVGQFLAS